MSNLAAIKRYRTRRIARLATRAFYLHKRGREVEMSNIICNEMVSLGGVYVKFMQGVLLKSRFMRHWQTNDRLKIFENLESEPLNIQALLQHELGNERAKQIAIVQPEPFAAGSFGQVYFGQMQDGTQVVIKVLRPMIKELLKYDLALIGWFSKRFVDRLSRNMDVQLGEAIAEFRSATLKETDYVEEAHFAHELYQHYQNHPYFIVPKTYVELCTSNVIVQEYIHGISAVQLISLKDQGVDPQEYIKQQQGSDLDFQLETLGFEAINGIFNLPRIQGDPHPGNIRFLPDNKIGIIDFGIAAHTPHDRSAFFGLIEEWDRLYKDGENIASLFEQFMRFFVSDLYRALKRLSVLQRSQSSTSFSREVGRVAEESLASNLGNADVRSLLEDGKALGAINSLVNKNNRFGLVMRLEASEILRAAQTYITLIESLGRRGAVMPRVFSRVVKEVGQSHPELRHQNDDSMSITDAIEVVSTWLERVAERDPGLFQQLVSRIKIKEQAAKAGSPS